MKKIICYTFTLLLFAAYAQQPPQASAPQIDLTPGTRAIADSEKEMFEYVKNDVAEMAAHNSDEPTRYPVMTPEDEATWRAQDYYILNEAKFLEDPDLNRLVACSVTKPEVAFFVGRLQTGEYRSYLVFPDNSGYRTAMSTFNYENILKILEDRMNELNCRDYKIVRFKRVEYFVFNAAGKVRVFHPMGDEMTCAQIVDLLQSKW